MNTIFEAIKERENQIALYQAQISGLQTEIEALRIAARIMENTNNGQLEAPRPVPVQVAQPAQATQPAPTPIGMEKKRVWP